MITKLPKQGVIFWPVGCGDSTTICVDEETVIQVDIHQMAKSVDKKEPYYEIVDELVKLLPKKDKMPYLSLFALTHPDEDHIKGFKYLLEKVKIGEIWFTPRIFIDYNKDLCEEAIAFKKEVNRRRKLVIDNNGSVNSGDRLRIIGYDSILEKDEFKGFPAALLTVPGNELKVIDGKDVSTNSRIFVHAPFKEDMDGDRNGTSLGVQIQLFNGESIGSIMLLGDSDYPIIKKIFDISLEENLLWDVFLAPHHCSKSVMYWKDNGEEQVTFKKDIMEKIEKAKGILGYIVSSSECVPNSNKDGDDPPHAIAKNRYQEIIEKDHFLCTLEHPKEDTGPIIFSFGDNGFEYKKHSKKDDSGSSNIPPAIIAASGKKEPASERVGFGK